MIVFLEGPDGCGKTQIAKALAAYYDVPYFKVNSEKQNWKDDTFRSSLWFDYVLPQFVEQVGCSFVSDRGYLSEFVYSKVFERSTRWDILRDVDIAFGKLGAITIIPLRRSYENNEQDELVPKSKLPELHAEYLKAAETTDLQTIVIYVDDFDNDLNLQMPPLRRALDLMLENTDVKFISLERKAE